MHTLSYESKASKPLSTVEMEKLLEEARANNNKQDITGCLIYYLGTFMQVLEGEKEIIEALYAKIKKDERHTNVHMFSNDHIDLRTFPNWGMAYYPIDQNNTSKAEFEQFKRNLLLLSDLTFPNNPTALTFWKRMKFLISSPPDLF